MGLCISNKGEDLDDDPLKAPTSTFEQPEENTERIYLDENISSEPKIVSLADFQFDKVLGRGSFGKVMLVTYKPTRELYAMKILKKDMIEKRNQRVHTKNERSILETVRNPFVVQLHFAFQTKQKLYLIMDFMIGGELFFHLRRAFRFQEDKAKFYAAELVLALEYLHSKGIVYRDLKPENILLGIDGHIKLTDFGLSKIDLRDDEKTNTFCGTPEYLAPEILLGQGHNRCVDWWSLGALLYEMLAGAPPFYNKDKTMMFRNRLEKPIEMKQWFSPKAIQLLKGLLNNDPNQRLGSKGAQEVKDHEFFKEINWELLNNQEIVPPFKPKVFNKKDLRHFDEMFTQEVAQDTPAKVILGKQETYERFTYMKQLESDRNGSFIQDNDKFLEINANFGQQQTKQ